MVRAAAEAEHPIPPQKRIFNTLIPLEAKERDPKAVDKESNNINLIPYQTCCIFRGHQVAGATEHEASQKTP